MSQVSAAVRLVLVRHGEAEGNRDLRYLGTTDVPLTAQGERQAARLGVVLAGWPIAAVYASPLQRARATGVAIAAPHGLTSTIEADLREGDFGAWENLTRAEVQARDPDALSRWSADPATVAPPGGEPLADVQRRAVSLADALAARHPGGLVALVSHVGPIKALLCAALGLPVAGMMRLWLDPASISVVDWRPATPEGAPAGIVRTINATDHLGEPPRWARDLAAR